MDTNGRARQLDEAAPGPGYPTVSGPMIEADELSFWMAGSDAHRLPDGVGIRVPAQADIVLQIHYHPSGKATSDRTRVGLYFSRKPVKQALHWNNATNYNFRLPAGNSNVEVKASWFVPIDLQALAVCPHMHQLGHDMHMSVKLPGGETKNLIEIADWDPPGRAPITSRSRSICPPARSSTSWRTSTTRPTLRNPNKPPRDVGVGPNTDDEMCVGYIAVVKKGQDLSMPGSRDDLFQIFLRQRQRQCAGSRRGRRVDAGSSRPRAGRRAAFTEFRRIVRAGVRRDRSPPREGDGDQYASDETTSPPLGVINDRWTTMFRLSLMNLTDPSPKRALTPPGWNP